MMRIDSVAARPDRAGRYAVKFADGTILRLYRQTVEDFRMFPGMEIEDLEIFENVAYVMAYHADHSIPGNIDDWLDQFERADYLEALGDIRLTYEGQMVSAVDAKKNNEEPTDN